MRRLPFLLLTVGFLPACDDSDAAGEGMQLGDAAVADAALEDAMLDAAGDAAPPAPDAAPPTERAPVDAPGPFAVGFHTETIEYTNPVTGVRPLDLHWWYPTDATEGAPVRYAGVFARMPVLGEAAPRPGALPLVVFSHGNGGLAEQSFFFTEFLASHGFIVVAPDHTGNTFRDSSEPIWRLFEIRPQDIGAVLDHADALPADHLLAGHLGPERALTGHSFGGYTSLAGGGAGYAVDALVAACAETPETEACQYVTAQDTQARYRAGFGDERVQALIPMTPAGANLFGGDPGLAGIDIPTLMMTAGLDATLPNDVEGDPLWDGITQADSLRLDFQTAGHFTFSNACGLLPGMNGDGCGEGFLDSTEAHRLINAYALAFLRLHLLGDAGDAALIDGTVRLDAGEIEISRVE